MRRLLASRPCLRGAPSFATLWKTLGFVSTSAIPKTVSIASPSVFSIRWRKKVYSHTTHLGRLTLNPAAGKIYEQHEGEYGLIDVEAMPSVPAPTRDTAILLAFFKHAPDVCR